MWRGWADRLGAAAGFVGLLLLGWYALDSRPAAEQSLWLDRASTNLANLAGDPAGALAGSAFVGESSPGQWVALALAGLVATGWVLGAWRTTVLAASAHVIGTYLSEGLLAYRIATRAAPRSEIYLRDVGPSYVVIAALAAGIAYGRWPGRVPAALGFALMAPGSFAGLPRLEVAAVGHVCAVLVALALGWPLLRDRRRLPYDVPADDVPVTQGLAPEPVRRIG